MLRSYLVCLKKDWVERSSRDIYCVLNKKKVSTQTMGSSFLDRIQSLKNSKYEGELIKIVDCLLDGHGLIDNSMLYLEIRK